MKISLTPGYTRDIKIRGQLHTTRPDWNQTKLNQPSRHFNISTTVMWLNKIKGASDRLYDQIMVHDRSEYTGWSNRSHWRYLCFDQYSRGTPGLIWRSVSDSRRLSVIFGAQVILTICNCRRPLIFACFPNASFQPFSSRHVRKLFNRPWVVKSSYHWITSVHSRFTQISAQ